VYSAPRTRPAVRGEARDALVGDSCQARYFRRVLAAERAQLDEKLANDMGKLSALGGFDEALGAKALRRRIRVMQRKRRELDRLIDGLDGWL
jgi:hypothetical protein